MYSPIGNTPTAFVGGLLARNRLTALAELEALIIAALEDHNLFTAIWQETITDEDRLDHYKLFMSRFMVTG